MKHIITHNAELEDLQVVAIRPGVLNNLLYTSEILKNTANKWNGVPVTVNHPVKNGKFVSVHSDGIKDTVIGEFNNVSFENEKLVGTISINKDAEKKGFKDVIKNLQENVVNVSTGIIGDFTIMSGEYKGKKYEAVVSNIKPDHLAILPNNDGACSIEDGCGTFKKAWTKVMNLIANTVTKEDVKKHIVSYLECNEKLNEVGDGLFYYEKEGKHFKRGFKIDNNQVFINTNKIEVERIYREKNMKSELIDKLIANTDFSDSDRETLEKLEESHLQKLLDNCDCQTTTNTDEKVKSEEVKEQEQEQEKEKELEPVSANTLSDADMALFNVLKQREIDANQKLRTVVADYYSLSKQVISNMEMNAVTELYNKIKQTSYVGKSGALALKNKQTHVNILLGDPNGK